MKNGTHKKSTTKGGRDLLVQAVMKPAKKH
jgi:hypothetical protein